MAARWLYFAGKVALFFRADGTILPAYAENSAALSADWERITAYRPKRILFAHANEKVF